MDYNTYLKVNTLYSLVQILTFDSARLKFDLSYKNLIYSIYQTLILKTPIHSFTF